MNLWNYYLGVSMPIFVALMVGSLLILITRNMSAAIRQFIAASTLISALMIGLVPAIPLRLRPNVPSFFQPSITFHPTPFETVYAPILPVSNPAYPSHFRLDIPSMLALVLAIISSLLALRLIGSLLSANRLRKRSVEACPSIRSLTNRDVRVVEGLSSPVALGGFKPLILLPAEASQWPEDQLRAILIHEEAHLDNGDPNWQILAELACLLNWFNPLVWFVRSAMRSSAERAADDAVIRAGILPSSYASNLISFASRVGKTRQSPAWTTFARKNGVKGRIKAILSPQIHRNPMKKTSKIASVVGLSLAAYLTSAYVRQSDANPNSIYQDVREGKTVAARASNNFVGRMADGREVEVIQISRQLPNGKAQVWKPDGTPVSSKDQIPVRFHSLDQLDTHVRYVLFRFPEKAGKSAEPNAGCGSGGRFAGEPQEMSFCGGGILSHKDGFYTVVSYIGLPKEDAAKFAVGFSVCDATWNDEGVISKANPFFSDTNISEVSKPDKGDLEGEKWWSVHPAPYTRLEFVVPNDKTGALQDMRIMPIFHDPSRKHSEANEYGSFGGYIQNPKGGAVTGFRGRYYFAYPERDIKEFHLQTRGSVNCEVYDLAANPKGTP